MENLIRLAAKLLKKGLDVKKVVKQLRDFEGVSVEDAKEAIELASARFKAKKKFSKWKEMYFDSDSLRMASPEVVSKYRAKRLKSKALADLCAGAGGNTIFFAQESKKVYAVELDSKRLEYAKKNAAAYGIKNVEFIRGDIMDKSVLKKLKDVEKVFCDPWRPITEKVRDIMKTQPPLPDILRVYSKITKNIAFEAPVQITPERIPLDCEKEYISVDGQLNRLTLYFGSLKRADRSVTILPADETLLSKSKVPKLKESDFKKYFYEPDPAVIKANLLPELGDLINASKVKGFDFLTSDKLVDSPFIKNRFEFLAVTDTDFGNIIDALVENNAGKIVLRATIEPQRFKAMKEKFELDLVGSKKLHLFLFKDRAVIAQNLAFK